MLKYRIIPTMLLEGKGLVKTTQFKKPVYLGDPINIFKLFNDKNVDEIVLLDIGVSRKKESPQFDLIEKCASECFMPLTVGGGIATLEQAKKVFRLGVEKVCLNTAALTTPDLVSQIADEYGSQSVVVSIDVKKKLFGGKKVFHPFLKPFETDPIALAQYFENKGAGEVLLQSVNRDGTRLGYDLELVGQVSEAISIPVVGCGGAGSVLDLKKVLEAGASAAAAGSMFVLHGPHDAVLVQYPQEEDIFQAFNKEA